MEIPLSRWSTAGRQRGARPYPKNELREPALGCAAYPRRASEARLRRRPVDSLEVHGTEARSTIANGLEWSGYLNIAADSQRQNLPGGLPNLPMVFPITLDNPRASVTPFDWAHKQDFNLTCL